MKLIALIVTVVLMAGVGAAWGYMTEQHDAATAAQSELADCRRLAAQIMASRATAPTAARPDDLTAAIVKAANNAGLGDGSLDRIDPGTEISSQRTIDLSIRQATVRQVVNFLYDLSQPPLGLRTERLNFTAVRPGGGFAVAAKLTYSTSDQRE